MTEGLFRPRLRNGHHTGVGLTFSAEKLIQFEILWLLHANFYLLLARLFQKPVFYNLIERNSLIWLVLGVSFHEVRKNNAIFLILY